MHFIYIKTKDVQLSLKVTSLGTSNKTFSIKKTHHLLLIIIGVLNLRLGLILCGNVGHGVSSVHPFRGVCQSSNEHLLIALSRLALSDSATLLVAFFLCVAKLWFMWRARNEEIFSNASLLINVRFWLQLPGLQLISTWPQPRRPLFHVQGILFGSNGFLLLLGFGNLLMWMGSSRCKVFVLAFQRFINLNSNAVAELWAVREGPRLALYFGCKWLYVHTDPKFVFNVFWRKAVRSGRLRTLLQARTEAGFHKHWRAKP